MENEWYCILYRLYGWLLACFALWTRGAAAAAAAVPTVFGYWEPAGIPVAGGWVRMSSIPGGIGSACPYGANCGTTAGRGGCAEGSPTGLAVGGIVDGADNDIGAKEGTIEAEGGRVNLFRICGGCAGGREEEEEDGDERIPWTRVEHDEDEEDSSSSTTAEAAVDNKLRGLLLSSGDDANDLDAAVLVALVICVSGLKS